MNPLLQLYRGENRFDFVGAGRKLLTISVAAVLLSILVILVRPLNLSIDFTGGTIVTAANTRDASVDEVREALRAVGQAGATVQVTGEGTILVRTEALPSADQDALVGVVAGIADVALDEINVTAVGPTFGAEVTRRAVQALVIFLGAVMLYITWRFEWKMAVASIASLLHDLIITTGVYALTGFLVTPATVIAVLTILGYSLYDTVIVFDKVNENVRHLQERFTYREIVNLSVNQVLMRSINTSLTSVLPVGTLLFVGSYALGAETLQEFALALFIGMAVGTYSSIGVAVPILALWKEGEEEWQQARVRVARRRHETVAAPEPSATAPSTAGPSEPVARPPKQRRKRR